MTDALLRDLWFHHTDDVALDTITITPRRVTLQATTTSNAAICPSCGTVSSRVHSRYVRVLDEAAVAGRRVVVELQVRRFRCGEPACQKATFVEQVPGLTFRHGRRSQGLQAALQQVALMLASRAGARLAAALATSVSRSTLLRLIRAVPESTSATPRVLGIDEFALQRVISS
ncbi:transposase family protein [Streptomyces sp. NPDC004237]|uniref:transposase family protein n=1 Tax=Streptomyces sp. NPDC004237 TaxID=3154455 RepID=UPI0033A52746